MHILLTGFEPFGKHDRNPSGEIAQALDGLTISGVRVVGQVLPVDTLLAPRLLSQALDEVRPMAVVCLGEAASRTKISIERVAVNLRDFRMPDNAGNHVQDEPVDPRGPDAIFATLPVRALHTALGAKEVPVELSLTAGAYLCNQIMYHALRQVEGAGIPAGFVHLPRSFSDPTAALDIDLPAIQAGVRLLLETLVEQFVTVPALAQDIR